LICKTILAFKIKSTTIATTLLRLIMSIELKEVNNKGSENLTIKMQKMFVCEKWQQENVQKLKLIFTRKSNQTEVRSFRN